jgi:peptidyl-prolyl cis-trans isomerase SurA
MNYLVYILLFMSFLEAQQEILLDRVASVVENKIVLMSDVVLAANAVAAQQQINPNTNPVAYKKILESSRESMVEQLLIIEMAEQDSVEILDKDIDKALNQQIDNIITQTGSKELAEAALGKKISDFKRSYRDDMKGKLLAEKYTSSLTSLINVSRGDVIDFFNTYKDSIPSFPTLYKTHHILIEIKPSEESVKNSLDKANDIRNKILNEEISFDDAAKTYSADPGSKDQGGNLGYVPRGTFVQEFDKVVFTVEKNILTEPVKTQYGHHIIEVLERTGEKVLARHILIRTETTDLDRKKTYDAINNIKNNIKNFDDFYKAAAVFSDDKTSNSSGGFLGMIDLEYYQVPELKKEIATIKTKTISNPIETDFGYHLIWVDEIQEGGPPTLETNWLELEEMALNKKKSDWYQTWINKIKSQFYIKRNPLTYPQING